MRGVIFCYYSHVEKENEPDTVVFCCAVFKIIVCSVDGAIQIKLSIHLLLIGINF